MRTREELIAEIRRIEADDAYNAPCADTDTNAPLALIQAALEERRRALLWALGSEKRRCRVCGCTDGDCRQCIAKTGKPCHWVEWDLCSACAPKKGRKKSR